MRNPGRHFPLHFCERMYVLLIPIVLTGILPISDAHIEPLDVAGEAILVPRTFFGSKMAYRSQRRQVMAGLKRMRPPLDTILRTLEKRGRVQARQPADRPFPCNVTGWRSARRPVSVHRLRPGDVDVIAALGDSVVAGNGLLPFNELTDFYVEDRGASGAGGGAATWRELLTLPNILKEFNPALVGYSNTTATLAVQRDAQLNVAEPMAGASDMLYQAEELLRRMRQDPRVDFQQDWKMVSLYVGGNDVCHMCYGDVDQFAERYTRNLEIALDYLRDNLPRALVLLSLPPDLAVILQRKSRKSMICELVNVFECPCFFGPRFRSGQKRYTAAAKEAQKRIYELIGSGKYHKSPGFTVLVTTSSELLNHFFDEQKSNRKNPQGEWSFFSSDCFHPGQKFHALTALSVWNYLMTGDKEGVESDIRAPLFSHFVCPTEENPFLRV